MGAEGRPTDDLTLGHLALDTQHVELMELLRLAARLAASPASTAEVTQAVSAFSDAFATHAAAEDRLMEASEYPERSRHGQAHDLFLADFERMRVEIARAGVSPLVVDWLASRLPEWLRFHILVNDAPLVQWLEARATVEPAPRRSAARRTA
jgi:hemerythrin-like metal-binding protein